MKSGFITDRGRRRPTNEDSLRACEDLDFFMLADGVGGNRSGEIASQSALDALEKFVRHNPPEWQGSREEVFRYFRAAVNYVNQFSHQAVRGQTTVCGHGYDTYFCLYQKR